MRAVTVYRVDYGRKTKDPIGAILEKRKTGRVDNYNDLLRLARRLFASDTADSVHIVIDVNQARGAILQDRRGSFEDSMSLQMRIAGSRREVTEISGP